MSKTIKEFLEREHWAAQGSSVVSTHEEAIAYFNEMHRKSLPPFSDHNTSLIFHYEQRTDGKFNVGYKARWPLPEVN